MEVIAMGYDSGVDLIEDIYTNGLTHDVIDRNKANFPSINLIIHDEGKFIQANDSIICFEGNDNRIDGFMFTTTNPYPTEDALHLLKDLKEIFHDMTVFDMDRKSKSDGMPDDLTGDRIFEDALPKICIFYIYNGQVIIDWSTAEDVSVNAENYGEFKNSTNTDRLHTVFWSKYMIKQFAELSGKSYLSVPRGRIYYDNKVFKILIDKEYVDNVCVRRNLEKECQLSHRNACGYSIEYITGPHYDYTRYIQ
jgi:hypothetical protein